MPHATPLCPVAQSIFRALTVDLPIGGQRHLDRDCLAGVRPPVCVERLTVRHYAIAHYAQQGRDLLAVPEMTFFVAEDGAVYPCSLQHDLRQIYRIGLCVTPEGQVEAIDRREQQRQTAFAATWLLRIAEQQHIPIPPDATDPPDHAANPDRPTPPRA